MATLQAPTLLLGQERGSVPEKCFKETKDPFKQRLRETVLGLPTSLVKKSVGDMRRRCREVKKSGGRIVD